MDKKSKKSIIIAVWVMLIVTLTLLGLTYAWYKTRIIENPNNESISITNKKMEIKYEDGKAEMNMTGKIEPGFTASKTFYVKNTGNQDVTYSVVLEEMTNGFIRNQDWQVTLTKNGTSVISENDKVNLAVGTYQILLGSETIDPSETNEPTTDTYVLTITYINSDEDQSIDMGSTLSFKVNISDETYTWNNAPEGSLLYALKLNQPTGADETIPGRAASLETEARILEAEDDNGTSYLYRGNVLNNYVNYSGMCFRIVRVQGDGTIKLVLADENGECNASTYNVNNTTSAFINGAEAISYSNKFKKLETWATNKNLDMSNLVDVQLCSGSGANYTDTAEIYYEAFARLSTLSTANPTLKCNTRGTSGSSYKKMIGTLSADEVAFAGYTVNKSSIINYLKPNAEKTYWTHTPAWNDFENNYLTSFAVSNSGYLTKSTTYMEDIDEDGSLLAIRPAIVLRSDVTATTNKDTATYGEPGTQNNPYVIL